MNNDEIACWLEGYVSVFQSCARGERQAAALLDYWGVPLMLGTDDRFTALMSQAEVLAVAEQQLGRLREASYERTEVLESTITALNGTSALCTAAFSWLRSDGSEIARPTVRFLISEAPDERRRISALLPHAAVG